MSDRNQLAFELSEIAYEVLNKLRGRDDVPTIGNIDLDLIGGGGSFKVQMNGLDGLGVIARRAELFECDVVIENKSSYFAVDINCDQYAHPVNVWTHLNFDDAVRVYAELGFNGTQKRITVTAKMLRDLDKSAEAVQS
jgi:hypothetical protein